MTYKQVATAAGSPRAFRAVGNIMNKNRDPKVPCHRVIRSDGSPGGYNRGPSVKLRRLRQERALVKNKHLPHFDQRVLDANFFDRSALAVARGLLGKYLVRRLPAVRHGVGRKTTALMITEVEAYDGFHDKASHARRGETARNAPMFGPAGHWYVYFTYGMHWLLNVVTGRRGYPAAVLIRGVAGLSGPARLTKALRVDKAQNGKRASRATGLWIEDRGMRIPSIKIRRAPRIGVDYAGVWAKKPYRFYLAKTDSPS